MFRLRVSKILKRNNKGFTLIEIIIVIAIIGIISAAAIPVYNGYREKAKETVCIVNCIQLEKMYNEYLIIKGVEHSDVIFEQLLNEHGENICTNKGVITYVEGKIRCSIHARNDDNNSEGNEDAPYL